MINEVWITAKSEHLAMVAEWFRKFGVPIAERPIVPDEGTLNLRVDLISEESEEFFDATLDRDIVGVADAIADLLYVVYGAALAWGIPIDECFREVHRSNMSKMWDGPNGPEVRRSPAGKILKPPTYSPPDLRSIIEAAKSGELLRR